MIAQDRVHDVVVLGCIACPMHLDTVRARPGLELLEILVEVGERVLLDAGGKRAQLFPLLDAMHLAIALLAQVPEPRIVHPLVFRGCDEALRRFRLVDRPAAADDRAARLLLGRWSQRCGGCFRMIESSAVAVQGIRIAVRCPPLLRS